jgi:ATP-dependent protease ClpP protease subunit
MSRKYKKKPPPQKTKGWYAINQAEGASEAEVLIYDVIGADGISAAQFVNELEEIEAETITVRINTPGGEVTEATAIYNALCEHPAEIVTQIDGAALSAGSFVALAGDEVTMANNAYIMIHEANGGVMGDGGEIRKYADVLDDMNDNIAGIYDAKAGKGKEYWRDLMAEETWFTAEEAKAEGLVDEVFIVEEDREALAEMRTAPTNVADFKNIPVALRERWGMKKPKKISAPDAATSVADAAGSSCQQKGQEMADNTTSPAQSTVAATDSVPVEDLSKDIAGLQKITHAGIFNQGKQAGIEVGAQQAMERFKSIIAACPGKPQMAIDAIEGGHTPEAVKLAFAAEARADARAEASAKEQQRQISTLQALVANGGTSGLSMAMGIVDSDDEPRMAPKDQAEWEWEHKPSVRKTAKDKATFMFARIAELDGSHRSFTRDPVSA